MEKEQKTYLQEKVTKSLSLMQTNMLTRLSFREEGENNNPNDYTNAVNALLSELGVTYYVAVTSFTRKGFLAKGGEYRTFLEKKKE